jgi:hypothetical protein
MVKVPADLRSLARAHTEAAVQTLAGIMRHPNSPPSARVRAATVLLDRGWGRPVQPIAGDGEEPLRVVIRHIGTGQDEALVIDHEPAEQVTKQP